MLPVALMVAALLRPIDRAYIPAVRSVRPTARTAFTCSAAEEDAEEVKRLRAEVERLRAENAAARAGEESSQATEDWDGAWRALMNSTV